jgi:hypothetical protein
MEYFNIFERALDDNISSRKGYALLLTIAKELSGSETAILSLFDFYQDAEKNEWQHPDCKMLHFKKLNENVLLEHGETGERLTKDEFFSFLALVSDVFLTLLPLGSLVKLKMGALKSMADLPDDYVPEVVIVDRYIAIPEVGIYLPYSGVVYPMGAFGTDRKIHFGPQLVEEVLMKGYSDEREDAFHILMKEEYILSKRLHSISFADEKEATVLQDIIASAKEDK